MAVREFDVARIATGLAFASAVPALHEALDRSNVAVISAAPGTGKTTLVPAVVANRVTGRVIVTQPRRVAARAAARRLASLDGSVVGDRVGFTVRGERRVSADTRLEMLTPGVLLRRLLTDADLAGVGAVIIDEVHERALETDVLLGILGEVRELREDLVVIAMSATVDAERFAALLAPEPAPIVAHEAIQHPLAVRWAPAEPRLDDRGITPAFLRHVATVAAHAHADLVRSQPGSDALVFAPGVREVAAIARHVREIAPDIDVRELHGQVPPQEQDDTIAGRPADERPRLIVATAIAESSLTVPGVSLVVDSCLSRVPRRDAARGMSGLVTTATSRASAMQRAGRATRQGPGTVIRCVDERTFAAAPAFTTPEIATSDLTDIALTLAVWGAPGGRGLRLPDAPPAEAMEHAIANLRSIGAVDDEGRATAVGRQLATIPADPRLAHALTDGTALFGTRAADVIALLSDTTISGSDLTETLRELRTGRHPQHRAWRREADRFARIAAAMPAGTEDTENLAGLVAALAFPPRIARRVADAPEGGIYLLASGTRAGLSGSLAQEPWIVVADVSRSTAKAAAGTGALIRAAAAISEPEAVRCAPALLTDRVEADVVDGRVVARRERRLGAITLSSVPVKAEGESAVAAIGRALQREGTGLFPWSEEATTLRGRLALLHEHIGEPWPDVSEDALRATLTDWLEPEIAALAAGSSAARIDMAAALRRLLPWPHAARFDELAPTRITVPSGSAIRVQYGEGEQPVVAVKLQECFGLTETPRIVDGRIPVLFHLLSPAGRPLAVTADLTSFWAGPYAQVRAEMRGRYPKHPWPEDPHSHVATAKTKRRLAP